MARIGLHQLAESGAADGDFATWDAGAGIWVPTPAASGEFLVTVINGVPSLVFDGDSHIVYTEVP